MSLFFTFLFVMSDGQLLIFSPLKAFFLISLVSVCVLLITSSKRVVLLCEASLVTTELASLMNYISKVHFKRQMDLLKKLVDYRRSGEELTFVEKNKSRYTSKHMMHIPVMHMYKNYNT